MRDLWASVHPGENTGRASCPRNGSPANLSVQHPRYHSDGRRQHLDIIPTARRHQRHDQRHRSPLPNLGRIVTLPEAAFGALTEAKGQPRWCRLLAAPRGALSPPARLAGQSQAHSGHQQRASYRSGRSQHRADLRRRREAQTSQLHRSPAMSQAVLKHSNGACEVPQFGDEGGL